MLEPPGGRGACCRVAQVSSGVPEGGTALEACLTADGKYILSGGEDRAIHVWSVASGQEVAAWQGHAGVPTCLKVWRPGPVRGTPAAQAAPGPGSCRQRLGHTSGSARLSQAWPAAPPADVCAPARRGGLRAPALCCPQWSPRKMLVASACQALALWVPDMQQLNRRREARQQQQQQQHMQQVLPVRPAVY